MKIICPKCAAEIPQAGINVAQGIASCAPCNEGFPLSTLLKDEPVRRERPADAKSVLTYGRDCLTLALPRGSSRAIGCFLMLFALFWNALVWFFVLTMVADLLNSKSSGTPSRAQYFTNAISFHHLLFLIPFVLVGLLTALIALYCIFGEVTFVMDHERGILRRALFGFKWDTKFELADVTGVRLAEAYRQNGQPVYGVGIFLKNRWRPLTFDSNLGEIEQLWLVGEIHAFWKEMTGAA